MGCPPPPLKWLEAVTEGIMKKQTQFKPGQQYMRRAGEIGTVREITAGRVVMDVISGAKRIPSVETFNPAHNPSWSLCM